MHIALVQCVVLSTNKEFVRVTFWELDAISGHLVKVTGAIKHLGAHACFHPIGQTLPWLLRHAVMSRVTRSCLTLREGKITPNSWVLQYVWLPLAQLAIS